MIEKAKNNISVLDPIKDISDKERNLFSKEPINGNEMSHHHYDIDIQENDLLRETPELLKVLLQDRTTGKNIIWATSSYSHLGEAYSPKAKIAQHLITKDNGHLIRPRVDKEKHEQKDRTKGNAEVFTPTWIVKKQNDLIEAEFKELPLEDYVSKIWLEITCGEAPYMCSRYDTVTGGFLDITKRVGFVDRKIQRISKEVKNRQHWFKLVKKAYQASYGYEFQGDSLLLARENLLYTFIDYYEDKFKEHPRSELKLIIAEIISYNVFQMDGLEYIIPYSEVHLADKKLIQMNLFSEIEEPEEIELELVIPKSGEKVKIKDWKKGKMITFESLTLEGGSK